MKAPTKPTSYNGNRKIKGLGVKIEWTPELLKELKKCQKDPIYFSKTYMKVVHVDRGIVPLNLYPYQKDMLKSFYENKRTISVTCRQAGKTTAMTAFALHYLIFNSHKTLAILANKGKTAALILARIKLAYEHLPAFLQQGIKEWNKASIELENGSKIVAGTTTSDSIRGESINCLLVDEMAWVENFDEFWASTYPTISSGETTKVIFCTTPNGLNAAHSFWVNAVNGTNGYHPIKVTWQQVPGRDEKWRKETLEGMNGDLEKFAQEYEVEWLGSSGTLIAGYKLKELVAQTPIHTYEGLTQFEPCIGNHVYAIIVDVSRGKGLDYSAFSVIDITTMPYKQVCVFRNNKITPTDYAEIVFRSAKSYNNALVLVEVNDIGEQVACLLHDEFEYECVLTTESGGREGRRISSRWNQQVDKGIRTTTQVKSVGRSMLKLLIEQNQLIVNDEQTIRELSTFSKKGRSYEAESGCHDDLVMGLVLFGWLSSQAYFKELTDNDTLKMLRDRTHEDIERNMMPFGIFDNGIETVFFDDADDAKLFSKWLSTPDSYERQRSYEIVREDEDQEAAFNALWGKN